MAQAWTNSWLSGPARPHRVRRRAASAQRPARELLGPGNHQSCIGSELEDTGKLDLAIGLAAELAINRRAVLVERPVVGEGRNQTIEVPQRLGPALGLRAVDHAVSLEVQDLL